MRNKPYLSLIMQALASAILAIALAGCGADDSNKSYRIGVSQCSHDDWRTKMNDEIEREMMFHEGATLEIRSADDDSRKQIDDIRYFADNGFDIIIVAPNEATALTPIIKEVYDRGIPIIIFDRNIIGDSYTARIGVDDIGLGRAAANYALSIAPPRATAIEIYGLPGSTPADDRHKGFSSEFTSRGGNIVATVTGNWNQDDASPAIDSLLRLNPGVDIIFAHNDRMAIGASEVARSLGLNDIKIIGIDAAPAIGIKAVADSVIDATFLYPTEGHRLVRTALAILDGKPYERETILPASSAVDLSNADILLLQNESIQEETDKMRDLKAQIDTYWMMHSAQTSLFYASIAIIVLLIGVVFMTLRFYWQRRRHQATLESQNRLLEQERDKQKLLNEKLQEATQSKLSFFTNVSHDLRTPLTLIAEPVAQLSQASNLNPEQRTLIKIANKNVRILHRLINQILDFRKIENDKIELNLSEIDLGQAIGDWLESFYALAHKRNLKLTLDVAGDSPITAAVDAEKMERVCFNLISNAFKYTPDNGSVAVTCAIEGENCVIRVADTGRGISERDLGNIFDRFYQVDRVHPNGSGIGLSLTKAFVELHGGTITVESTPNKGSVFTVTLPIRHIADKPVVPAKYITSEDVNAELETIDIEPEFESEKPLVLIIDDNKDIRLLVSELLKGEYNIITASNGSEGLRKAARYVPDLIICDVMMPVMDGLECLRRLKDGVSTSHIPVLMLTACSMDEQRIQGYDNGADGYLAKPFAGDVLRSRAASLIANRKRIDELWRSAAPYAQPTEKKAAPTPQTAASDIDNDFYNRFLTVFMAEIGNPDMNVDAVASKLGLERSQFYRKIKALTNYSPVELMRSLRLKQARHLLTSTEKNISEIAYETGFSSPAYFTKCYREVYGETPSETRSSIGR